MPKSLPATVTPVSADDQAQTKPQKIKGKRLLNSFGLFRGVQVPESLLDEPLDSLPYWDRFYRFLGGEYRFTGESPKPSSPPHSGG